MDDYLRGFVAGYEAKSAASDPPTFPPTKTSVSRVIGEADVYPSEFTEGQLRQSMEDIWRNAAVVPGRPRRKMSAVHKAAISRAAKARAKAKRAKAKGRA